MEKEGTPAPRRSSIGGEVATSQTKKEDEASASASASASRIVGRIVEKGFSTPSSLPLPRPRPTLLPFPVARHRSHGPHWAPIGSEMDHEDDVSADDDNYYAASGTISAFANPIQRKQKKVLDFSRWRDLISKDGSDVFQENKLDSLESDKRKRDREWTEIADKRNTFHPSLPQVDAFSHITKSGEVITSDSGVGILGSVVHIELDKLDPLPVQKYIKEEVSESDYAIPNIFEYEPGFTSLKSQTDTENCALEIRQVQTEVKEKMKPGLSEVLNKHGQHKFEKQRNSTSNLVSRSNFEDVQVSTSLESQIDAENRAWLQKMSHDEIAQAQAEIMDKMKPELVDALKKRGRDKAGKKKGSTSGIATSRQLVTPEDGNHLNQNIRDGTLAEGVKTSRTATTAPTKVTQRGLDNGGLRTLGTPNSRLWSVWSERVETARALRFSLDGAVVENDSIQVSKTGTNSGFKNIWKYEVLS